MAHTKTPRMQWRPSLPTQDWIWLLSFLTLPLLSYFSLGLLGILLLISLWQRGRGVLDLLKRHGFWLLSLGLIISSLGGINPGNACLQLTNFIPYFLLFGVMLTSRTALKDSVRKLTLLAEALVITSLPISMMALIEYSLKASLISSNVNHWPALEAFLRVEEYGRRAHGLLGHPNILSSYLVIVLGLGFGLLLRRSALTLEGTLLVIQPYLKGHPKRSSLKILLWGAIVLGLIGLFCTGSRNGMIVVMIQLVILGTLARWSRSLVLISLGIMTVAVLSVLFLGFGDRQLTLALMTQDPRMHIWPMAINLIQQRPWLGWGLGGFGEMYAPGTAPGYDHIHHAHNIWLYLASETGIPLMVGFSFVIGRFYYQGIRKLINTRLSDDHRAILIGYLLAFGSCIIFGLFDVPLFDARINVLNWLMLAGVSILANASSLASHSINPEAIGPKPA